jgi:hypothetical protein
MTLDLSKLSPRIVHEILQAVQTVASEQYRRISTDLAEWEAAGSKGEAYLQMCGWRTALSDLQHECALLMK